MMPVPYRIVKRKRETKDIFTFELVPAKKARPFAFLPGPFNMIYAFGLGEVPISISGNPEDEETLVHTIRTVGAVTNGLGALRSDDSVAVRGPFGAGWPMKAAEGKDVIVAAGGLGLAPQRPAIYSLLAHAERYGRLTLLYGARGEDDLLFLPEVEKWRRAGKIDVHVSVDQASRKWKGTVGHVTAIVPRAQFDPGNAVAMLCGPEVMMRFTAMELEKRGLSREGIYLSMERNMKCAVGFCGHCQFGPHFICADGPVFPYPRIEPWMRIREL